MDNEIREYVIGFDTLSRQQPCIHLVISVERGTDEEEYRRDRYEKITAEKSRKLCCALTLRRVIPLHIILVDAIILQVDENPVYQTYPKGAGVNLRSETSKREFVVGNGDVKCLLWAAWHIV